MKLKKVFSAAAAAFITASVVGVMPSYALSAGSEDELTDGIFTYELVNGTYTIVKCDGTAIIESIPSIRNGYAVTAIADEALAGCTYIEKLAIPDTIKSIGTSAFASCSSLKSVRLPDKLTEIPEGAFMGCANLTEVNIPESVETIGNGAFYGCTALESAVFSDNLASIGEYAFQRCYALKEVNLPSGLETLGNMAFLECPSVTSVTADNNSNFVVKDNILYSKDEKTILYAAAYGTPEKLYIPDTVTEISDGAFCYATQLKSLFLPSSVTKIGSSAFYFCTGLENIDFSEGLLEIGPLAFESCTSLSSLSLPTTLKKIGSEAFCDNAALEKVIMAEGVETIGAGAFFACDSLKNLMIPKSVTTVEDYAFGYTVNNEGTDYAKCEGFKVSVYSGSAAEKFAKNADLEYTRMDRNLKTIVFIIVGVGILLTAAVFAVVLMKRSGKKSSAKTEKSESDEAEDKDYESILSDGDDE